MHSHFTDTDTWPPAATAATAAPAAAKEAEQEEKVEEEMEDHRIMEALEPAETKARICAAFKRECWEFFKVRWRSCTSLG